MRATLSAIACLAGLHAGAAAADTLACPDRAGVVQVGTCPTEAELKYTFTGYCSDNARMYARDDDECADFQRYRRLKNVSLWESADGAFHAYVSCDLPTAAVRSGRASAISVATQGKLNRVVCAYPDGISFVHRTKAQCKVEGDGRCGAEAGGCSARCD